MRKTNNNQCFIDCKDIDENTAVFDFNSNELKLGKVNLNSKQIEKISFLLAHDLKTFAETNGNFSTLSANAIILICKTINKQKIKS